MLKKSIFVVLTIFGLNSVADTQGTAEVDHMSDMMHSDSSSEEESNFSGSVELKYKVPVDGEGMGDASSRVRLGWKGDVNDVVHWKAGVTSGVEQAFNSPSVSAIHLEHYSVSYTPVEGLSVVVGKHAWQPKFHKTGVLYDDDIYPMGGYVKYHYSDDATKVYAKVATHVLDEEYKGPLNAGVPVVKGKVGGKYTVSDMHAGAYVAGEYDGISEADNKTTLARVGVYGGADMVVPVGVFGVYVTNVDNVTANHSYTVGGYVGNAGTPTSGEAMDFGLAASYYDIYNTDYNTALLDTDYVAAAGVAGEKATRGVAGDGGRAQGVAVRGQYNIWDSVNVVAKYAYDLGAKNHNVVGEMTFNF